MRRVQTLIDETYDIKQSDGDLFYWMDGTIAPLPPEEDKVVAHVHITTDANGFRNIPPEKATPEFARQHMDHQADLLADFAAKHNINYLDLTPYFRAEAGTSAELYYWFDTHWNQLGHDLAAETINEYIKEMLPNTVKTTPGN